MKTLIARIPSLIFFLITLGGAASGAVLDVPFSFSTIDTEHFSIHYNQGFEAAANKAAVIAEDVHASLIKKFKNAFVEKTHIVLVDDADLTHSASTALPYNAIYIQPVPPAPDSPAGGYDDWLTSIITREYARILSNDASRGYSSVLRRIFGKPAAGPDPFTLLGSVIAGPPNAYLPEWWQDGLEAFEDTEGAGKGKKAYYGMVLRMAVMEGDLPSIDRINGDVPDWPGVNAPYVFGLELHRYIAWRYGSGVLEKLNERHSGRFPYFLNGAPEGALGADYIKLYEEAKGRLKERESKDIRAIEGAGPTPASRIPIKGEILTNPRYSHDGGLLAVNVQDPHTHESIVIASLDGSVKDAVRRLPSDRAITWAPDGGAVYFSQEEINKGFYTYEDLYSYDIAKRKLKRLTYGLRAHGPDLSPDGKRFALVVNKRGSQNLALLNLKMERGSPVIDEDSLEPVTEYELMRVSGPRWSPDGSSVVYAVTDNSGNTAIHIYDAIKKTRRKLLEDKSLNAFPVWSRDGRFIIYSSDETGVYNLHACSIDDGKKYQVTNLAGGAFQSDISPDGKDIVFSSYGARGFAIEKTGYMPSAWRHEHGPYMDYARGEAPPPAQDGQRAPAGAKPSSPVPYNALKTLAPRFWLPTLSRDHDGLVLGAYTAGQDVLAYNAYQIDLDYGTASSKTYFNGVYVYDYLYPSFAFEARRRPFLYSNFLQKGDYYELLRSYTARMTVPVNHLESNYSFTFGYTWQRQSALSAVSNGLFRGVDVFQGRRSYAFTGVEFSNALRYPYSISKEEGRALGLLYRAYSKAFGSHIRSNEYTVSYTEYLSPGLLNHNVIYLNVKGGLSSGARIAQQAFQLGGYNLESDFPLRGYPARSAAGKYIGTATLEYRAPLGYIFKGINTKPLFMEKLHGSVFTEAGEVWGGGKGFSYANLKYGAGVEARLDMTVGYRLKVTPAIGIAHGFNQDGDTRVYFTIYSNL